MRACCCHCRRQMTLTAHSVCRRQRRRELNLSMATGGAMPSPLPPANDGGNPLAVADDSRGGTPPPQTAGGSPFSLPAAEGTAARLPLPTVAVEAVRPVADSNGGSSLPLPTRGCRLQPALVVGSLTKRSLSLPTATWLSSRQEKWRSASDAESYAAVRTRCRRQKWRSTRFAGGGGAIDSLYATTTGAVAHSVLRAMSAAMPMVHWNRASAPHCRLR